MAFFKAENDAMPVPSDADMALGTKKYVAVEDLTGPTFKILKELQEDTRVEKAWSIDVRIRMALVKSPLW
jgi:hypothetical protein